MEVRKALGNRIRVMRKQRDLTQEELSEKIGRSVDGLSLIERGQNWPSSETLDRLAEAFEVDPSDLFDGLPTGRASDRSDALAVARDTLSRLSKKDLLFAVDILALLEKRRR